MRYILRTTTGTILSNRGREQIFESKKEAIDYLLLIQNATTERWKIIELDEDLVDTNLPIEEPLHGGNISNVSRKGKTVRREQHNNNYFVHLLLQHLEKIKYPYSPRFLGIDKQNREVLTFIDGEAGNYPLKQYMWSNESLEAIAKMLRGYHDAVENFHFKEEWMPLEGTPEPLEIICHNDFAIYNIIFNKEQPVGIIDFDMAAPGPKMWDVVYSLYTSVPLSRFILTEDEDRTVYDSSIHGKEKKNRVKIFLKSYGVDLNDDIFELLQLRLNTLCKTIEREACNGNLAYQKMIKDGHVEHYKKDIQFIQKYKQDWI